MTVLIMMGMRSTAKAFYQWIYHYSYLWVLLHMQLPWWWRCKETSVKYISSGFKLNPCVPCGWIQWKSIDLIMSSVELLTVLPDWSVWTPQWPGRYQDGRGAFHHGWPPDELYHGIQSTRTYFATLTTYNYNNNTYFFVKTSLQRFEY